MDVISQEEAKKLHYKWFYTGKPCGKGHLAPRYVSSGNCDECMKGRRGNRKQINVKNLQQSRDQAAGLIGFSYAIHPDDEPMVRALVDALAAPRYQAVSDATVAMMLDRARVPVLP